MPRIEGPSEELWRAHKQDIYRYYIVQQQTLKTTMEVMRNCHQFYASQTQFTTQLAAWGFVKNSKADDYPGIISGIKRRRIDLDEIESVTVMSGFGGKVLSRRQVKKGWARYKRLKVDAESFDAPSPPGFAIQCRQVAQSPHFKAPQYPFLTFIKELTDTLRLRNSYSSEGHAVRQGSKGLFHQLQTPFDFGRTRPLDGSDSSSLSIKLPDSVSEACKSIAVAQSVNLEPLFRAMFRLSNNKISWTDAMKLGEWLSLNVEVRTLCRFRSWTAKPLLTCLLHGAVKMDAIAVLREAHLRGADLESPALFDDEKTLLQCSLLSGSVQCSKYLIEAGADVSVGRYWIGSFYDYDFEPLHIASRSKQCVDLIPELLCHGASPNHHYEYLLEDCINSGATVKTIKSLVDSGVSPSGQGGLSKAASLGRLDIMELLISAGASIEGLPFFKAVYRPDREKHLVMSPPAVAAAASGCVEALEFLMRHGLDLNASFLDKFNVSRHRPCHFYFDMHPIQCAVRNGDYDMVKYLFKRGASLKPRYGTLLLVLAAEKQDLAMVTLLLELGADASSVSQAGSSRPTVSALGEAAARGWLPGMQLLINAGAHIDFCGSTKHSRTALQRAAKAGYIRAVEMLLESGADINAPPCPIDGLSTLQALIRCGNLALVDRAISAGASVHPSHGESGSPLCAAVATGKSNLVSLLIRLGANVSLPSAPGDKLFRPVVVLPLQLAAERGHLDICKILIQAKADIDGTVQVDDFNYRDFNYRDFNYRDFNYRDFDDDDIYYRDFKDFDLYFGDFDGDQPGWRTPLAIACYNGYESLVKYLISQNASPHGKTSHYHRTPLYHAIESTNVEIVRLLLQHDLDPNYFCLGRICDCDTIKRESKETVTPLIKVVERFYYGEEKEAYQIVELLIRYGADPNYRPSLRFNTPLQGACCFKGWEVAKLLLSHGADINAPCSDMSRTAWSGSVKSEWLNGINAFQTVVLCENMEMVELFLSRGADVHTPAGSRGRCTALQAAAFTGNIEIAARLLQEGAQVDELPADHGEGRTAIQFAAEFGRLEMLGFLLSNYRGPRSIAEICDDATEFALKKKHIHIVGYLQEYKEQNKWRWEKMAEEMMAEFLVFDW